MVRKRRGTGDSNLIRFPHRLVVKGSLAVEESLGPKKVAPENTTAEIEDPDKTFKRLMREKKYPGAAQFAREHNMATEAKRAARLWISKLMETKPHEAAIFARNSELSDEFGIALKRMLERFIRAGVFEIARLLDAVYHILQPEIMPDETVPINLKQIARSVADDFESEGKEIEAARIRKAFGL
ncbi:MAG: hypothetical protein AABW86_01910 [Candidatus Micrarchaeota archaeon]